VDHNLGLLYRKIQNLGGLLIVTADHGNSEYMLDDSNNVITAHTTNKVPFIVCNKNITLKDGKLGDIAPTMLNLMGQEVPSEMTGTSLVDKQ
jgi:2,3-bisphosphoglycerate-independent phosphoglycerate mutase